jgi:hypothetical protein
MANVVTARELVVNEAKDFTAAARKNFSMPDVPQDESARAFRYAIKRHSGRPEMLFPHLSIFQVGCQPRVIRAHLNCCDQWPAVSKSLSLGPRSSALR